MKYCDAHCHLGSRQYDSDRSEVIDRMLAAGVRDTIIICCSEHDMLEGVRLRREHPGFRLALSIHPQDLEDSREKRLEELQRCIEAYHPDMIGETGLDYYSHPHTKEAQKHFFISQLELARQFHLPVNIHIRRASADALEILKAHPCRGIIHSYSGSIEMAELYMKAGYDISFGASILFPNARRPREVIAKIPLERLFIETDAPYQSPIRDHRHEPADVLRIYEETAKIRGISAEQLCEAVYENFQRIFR